MARKFSSSEIEAALAETPGWAADGDCLVRTLLFGDHITAFGFVTRVAMAAEAMDHHPDLRIAYNRVELRRQKGRQDGGLFEGAGGSTPSGARARREPA
ncbi:MAG: 4a-hydroxytetrahydrobiopterin dehydratase [Thermoflexaceae bacterium]|nr:4a-hydroxytetrahydrobiopterin dehydratase [Thermoflexaceae bacterium]